MHDIAGDLPPDMADEEGDSDACNRVSPGQPESDGDQPDECACCGQCVEP